VLCQSQCAAGVRASSPISAKLSRLEMGNEYGKILTDWQLHSLSRLGSTAAGDTAKHRT
jgi:hypothetical protein